MTEKPIRVAVVGVGDFGRNHVRVWSEMEGVELVGVVDTNAERAAQVAAEFKTRVIRDFESLPREKIDAVSLAVPTKDHSRIGCRLLDSGMDVLVEKPMASSLGEADGLIATAQRNESHSADRPSGAIQSRRHRGAENRFASRCSSKCTAWEFSRRAAWILT